MRNLGIEKGIYRFVSRMNRIGFDFKVTKKTDEEGDVFEIEYPYDFARKLKE